MVSYDVFLKRYGIDPARAAMFEDTAKNLKPAHLLGMRTVWMRNDRPSAQPEPDAAHIHHVADELAPEQPGCLFVSFIYESGLGGDGVDDVVQRSIREWRGRILAKLEAIARRPSFPPVDLPSLADQVFTIFEGAFLLARALDDPTALRRQLEHLRHYVELLAGRPVAG